MNVAQYVKQLERVAALAKAVAEETDEGTLEVDPIRWGMLLKALDHLDDARRELVSQ